MQIMIVALSLFSFHSVGMENSGAVCDAKNQRFFSMAKASSINFQAVKPSSESHNQRRQADPQNLLYSEYAHLNKSEVQMSIRDREKMVREKCKNVTGRQMRSDATPIREAVLNIKSDTTIEDLKRVGEKLEQEKGIQAFQFYIHKDEGRKAKEIDVKKGDAKKVGEFKRNEHAHIVFDWTDKETGKVLRLGKKDMREIQTMVAKELGMKRGKSSDIKHLSVTEYKIKAKEEQLREITNDRAKEINQYDTKIDAKHQEYRAANQKLIDKQKELQALTKVDLTEYQWESKLIGNKNKENFENLQKIATAERMQRQHLQHQVQKQNSELLEERQAKNEWFEKYKEEKQGKEKAIGERKKLEKFILTAEPHQIENVREKNAERIQALKEQEQRAQQEKERKEQQRNNSFSRGR